MMIIPKECNYVNEITQIHHIDNVNIFVYNCSTNKRR